MLRALVVMLTILLLAPTVEASCGLDLCPAPYWKSKAEALPRWRLSDALRLTSFSVEGVKGHYVESTTRAQFTTAHGLRGGLFLPIVALFSEGRDAALGIGNATGYVDLSKAFGELLQVRLGTQLETPTGTREAIASDHFELLPYVGMSIEKGRYRLQTEVGLRLALGGGHEHSDDDADHVLVVNPHEDREIVYQSIADMGFGASLRPGLLLRGQQVLSTADHRSFVTAGAQLTWTVSEELSLLAIAEIPVVKPSRFDLRAGVQASVAF